MACFLCRCVHFFKICRNIAELPSLSDPVNVQTHEASVIPVEFIFCGVLIECM